MQKTDFDFLLKTHSRSLSRWWLLLGCTALAIAGLFAIVLVIARTPQLASLPLFARLFHESLVVHVDLSVLTWFLCIACLLWSLLSAPARTPIPYLEQSALITMGLSMLAMALSPLDPKAEALMSNYIPVIHSPVFYIGLALLFCSVLLILVRLFLTFPGESARNPLHFALYGAGLVALIALTAFIWSYQKMPLGMDGPSYYDLLFWGGGHVLQFLHAQILMVCWLVLMAALAPNFSLSNRLLYILFFLFPLVAMATPFAYMENDIANPQHRAFFTHSMIAAGGIAPGILALVLLVPMWRARGCNALWATLAASIVLFIYGGALGEMIRGQNVVIPAHYHGSIVGITLAFMGAAYVFLPRFGYRDPQGWKLAFWQPIVYAAGQILHISGLAWSGGYGVLRKTPGALESGMNAAKIAMGLMGGGGLLAVIGGLLFVVVVIKAVKKA